jgi:DNA-directed RNA polymerase specialized sigma24 family protein
MKRNGAPPGAGKQPSDRAQMLREVEELQGAGRAARLLVRHGKSDHIDDEVVVTLALNARRRGDVAAENEFSSAMLRRIAIHVKAHVGRNPSWQQLGGGKDAAVADFTQSIALLILKDPKQPCHAEVAFGDYVYKKTLDEAGKLFAKKHSAGQTLDGDGEADAQDGDIDVAPAGYPSPEDLLQTLQEEQQKKDVLRRIRDMVQSGEMPEKAKVAFTFRYYGQLPIDSKKDGVVTIVKLMGVTEKTVTKYINEAIALIRKGLEQ